MTDHDWQWSPSCIVAVDTGTTHSALVVYDPEVQPAHRLRLGYKASNAKVKAELSSLGRKSFRIVIEMLGHYGSGMSVGKEVYHTALWIGRMVEAWGDDDSIDLVLRKAYASHLCGSPKAKDGNIRQAVIDRFGGDSAALGFQVCEGCGGKGAWGRGSQRLTCPSCQGRSRTPKGPLYDVSADVWQALGLAIAYSEGVKVIPREEWAAATAESQGTGAAHG